MKIESQVNIRKKQTPKLGKGIFTQRVREQFSGYLYISPFFILFGVFGVFPVLYTAYISFFRWDILGTKEFIGLANYKNLMTDPLFWKALGNTLSIWVLATIPKLVFGLIIAFILHQAFLKAKQFFRLSLFLPYITSVVAVALIFGSLFGEHYGIVNYVLSFFGVDSINWRASTWTAHIVIAFMVFWRSLGFYAILYLTGLQTIPKDLYEAATIDGASKIQQFIHITIPMLRPIIIFTVILSTITGFQIFAEPQMFLGAGGGAINQGLTLTLYLYEEAFVRHSFGYASSVAWILFIIIVVFSLINFYLSNKIKST